MTRPLTQARRARRPHNAGGRPARISRELILQEARRIPSGELTLPLIAARLGVKHTALYRHFASRDALVAELAALLFADFEPRPANPARWREWLFETLLDLYRFMLANPVMLEVESRIYTFRIWLPILETALQTLMGAGFASREAAHLWSMATSFVFAQARAAHDAALLPLSAGERDEIFALLDSKFPRLSAVAAELSGATAEDLFAQTMQWYLANVTEPCRAAGAARNGTRGQQRKKPE